MPGNLNNKNNYNNALEARRLVPASSRSQVNLCDGPMHKSCVYIHYTDEINIIVCCVDITKSLPLCNVSYKIQSLICWKI